jgi:hypothetical protein
MSLNDKILMRKSIKQKETQVDDMKNLTKIISIATNYAFLIEKKSLLNKKSTNNKTCTTTRMYNNQNNLNLTINYCFFLKKKHVVLLFFMN